MKEFWNTRYAVDTFVYGKKPNVFFEETLDKLQLTGNILLPAEGEGRNAVHAAKKGLSVFAFDISEEARKKALLYSGEEQVRIHYEIGDLDALTYERDFFDVVALIYAHFPPHLRAHYHSRIGGLVKPGGFVILEGFSTYNLEYRERNPSIGGPAQKDMLFTTEVIRDEFADFEIIQLEEILVNLAEGIFHNGIGSVIRFVGKKRVQ